MKTFHLFSIALAAGVVSTALAREVRFEDCPPAVQRTITAESKGGRIDEIDFQSGTGRYVAEIDFGQTRDSTLEIASDGRLVRKVEDIRAGQLPKPVKRTVRRLQEGSGRIDELERETTGRRVIYRVEIDYPNDRDEWFTLTRKGAVLKKSARD